MPKESIVFLILGGIFIIGAILAWHVDLKSEIHTRKAIIHTEPPPGYEIVCDIEKKVYGIKMSQRYMIEKSAGGIHKTRQEAIERAWGQYNYIPEPEKEKEEEHFNWQKCN